MESSSQRLAWHSDLVKNYKASLQTPSWLWAGVVELIGLHEAAYLEHCRHMRSPRLLKTTVIRAIIENRIGASNKFVPLIEKNMFDGREFPRKWLFPVSALPGRVSPEKHLPCTSLETERTD